MLRLACVEDLAYHVLVRVISLETDRSLHPASDHLTVELVLRAIV